MYHNPCPICGDTKNLKIIYPANFKTKDLNLSHFSARRLPDRIHYQIVQCKKDQLIRSNPIIEPVKINKLYKESLLTYQDQVDCLQKTYLELISPYLKKIKEKDKILEIGCGNGFLLQGIYNLGFKNISGLELSKDALKKTSKNIKEKIKALPLRNNLFSPNSLKLILIFQTFDHISNPNEILKICYKILSKGGYLLIFNHNIESFSAKLLKEKSPTIDIEHIFFFTAETLSKLLKKHRFKIFNISYPSNWITLKHLIWLFPLPLWLKSKLVYSNNSLLRLKSKLALGNLLIVATK